MQRLTPSILIVLALLGVASFWVVPPIPQPQLYHNFADQRSLSGIPNFWNVISNLPFLIIGGWGILYLSSGSAPDGLQDSTERWMFLFFFIAVAFTGVGSAYYHLAPNNERLVWDRLPITMANIALFAIIIAERLSRRVGALLFVSLIVFGLDNVHYWRLSATSACVDLRPYL